MRVDIKGCGEFATTGLGAILVRELSEDC